MPQRTVLYRTAYQSGVLPNTPATLRTDSRLPALDGQASMNAYSYAAIERLDFHKTNQTSLDKQVQTRWQAYVEPGRANLAVPVAASPALQPQ